MSFFSCLRKKQAVEMDDHVFGHMTFDRGIWTHIPVTSAGDYMITVDGVDSGPTAEQRDLFEYIRSRLDDFVRQAQEYMWTRDKYTDTSGLTVYSVAIGSSEEALHQEFILELSDKDAEVIHHVSFRAGKPIDYGVDD